MTNFWRSSIDRTTHPKQTNKIVERKKWHKRLEKEILLPRRPGEQDRREIKPKLSSSRRLPLTFKAVLGSRKSSFDIWKFYRHHGNFRKKSKNGFLFFVWGKSGFGISGMFLAVTFRHENTSDSLKLVSFVSLRNSSGAPTWAGSGLFYNCT